MLRFAQHDIDEVANIATPPLKAEEVRNHGWKTAPSDTVILTISWF